MKIAITGANGYIGRHVVQTLMELGHDVTAVDIHFEKDDEKNVAADIFDFSQNLFKKLNSPEALVHLAWQDGFQHNSDSHLLNLANHYNFIRLMADSGCKNISVMGTMHECGFIEGRITAATPCNPLNLYGIAKNALRQSLLLLASQAGFSLKWLRAFYILGDDLKNHSLFCKILQMEKDGKKTFPFTKGNTLYDFISIDELAKQISAAAIQTDVTGVINVCSGEPVTLKDKVEDFILEHHLKIRPEFGAFPDRIYDSKIIYGDVTQIKKIIETQKY